jgi:predicted transcriptional regulator
MMDAKKLVKILRDKTGEQDNNGIPVMIYVSSYIDEIADFIEQQDRELATLREQRKAEINMRLLAEKMKKGEIVIPPDAIVFTDTAESIEQNMKECEKWEQYAELGRLVVEEKEFCNHKYEDDDCMKWGSCSLGVMKICQKRAELLVEGRE